MLWRYQRQVPILDGGQPPDHAIRFRMGIDIGDAIADGTDLHGDGVIVAAKIQAECPPEECASPERFAIMCTIGLISHLNHWDCSL